ncbi:MAG: cyclic nucleotide-binding domain-containing protein [Alphaproteobacteria bacterium]|jgi:CRP/FNR family transcriptional regulator, cyclic AMP receptor protein|nr:cyclic nucleotide-binding domain-containing protein [Alphaproteobacteria bacterium]MBT4086379.1 cyclic nucleotide-binding domain-containing protein [Alphaproteobacteria bacterium]MBT4546359.1 cyclic nucleotide-binding domain-containing protein [Alphaproteobacteria bacterium]MBT7744489.1 cyclic nucleotide-binding domain-containing protein [Alphaproteobacteria bacterium]
MGLFDYPKSSEMAQRMLDEFTFLGEASSDDWDIIRAHVETKNFGAGEKLVRYGEIDTSFFILTEGTVEIVVEQSDGEPHVLSNIPKGSVFGEIAFFDGQPRSATILSRVSGSAMKISRENFNKLSQTHPKIANLILFDLARILALRLRWTTVVSQHLL